MNTHTTLNLSNQAVSEVFVLPKKSKKTDFDHMLATFHASNTVVARLYKILTLIFCPKSQKIPLLILQIKHTTFSLFKAYHILIYPKAMARIFISVPFILLCHLHIACDKMYTIFYININITFCAVKKHNLTFNLCFIKF